VSEHVILASDVFLDQVVLALVFEDDVDFLGSPEVLGAISSESENRAKQVCTFGEEDITFQPRNKL